ncbi:MAG: hypothetical protein ACKO2P_16085 [Planctomycetota bacterium]
MPIQFRCEFCRQRLGIADSKAGALVDCPACGRSLKVPDADGKAPKTSASRTKAAPDPQLHSALQRLSEIGLDSAPESNPAPDSASPTHKVVPRKAAKTPATPAKHGPGSPAGHPAKPTATADPLNELAALPAAPPDELPLLAEPELLEESGGDEEVPASPASDPAPRTSAPHSSETLTAPLATALAELAAQPSPAPVPVAPHRSALKHSFPVLIPLLTALLMFTAGYLAGNTTARPPAAPESPPAAPSSQIDSPAPAPTPADTPVPAGRISGLIQAASADGNTTPDAGALVIIAPAMNPSELRIDGRFLRDAPDTPGRRAITTALEQLGVRLTFAADDGTYSLPLPAPGPCVLIVVSRRNARPASAPLPADVATHLNQWFTAPSPVTGRLQTVVRTVTAPGNATGNATGVQQTIIVPAM